MITGNENAYPVDEFGRGLTIRQHFAAIAMHGLISSREFAVADKINNPFLSELAITYADALIEQLNKETP